MGTALELLDGFKKMNFKETVKDVFRDSQPAYIEKQQEQMLEGKGKNKNIGRYRNPEYSRFKNSLSSTAGLGNVDLKLTGSFFNGMNVKLINEDIEIDSSDSKSADLTEKYGGQIWGLNVKKQSEYIDQIFTVNLFEKIEKATGLKIQ